MASVDYKVKYEEELKARKRAELERDTLAKQFGKKPSGITVEEVQEEQAQLVFNNNALALNGVNLDQLKNHNQIGVLADVNSRDVPVFVELHGEKDLAKVTRVRIIVEAEDEPAVVANDADLDAVVSHANEGKLDVPTVKKAHKKPSLRLPLFRFLFDHRRKSHDKESKQKANAAVLAVVPNKKLFKELMDAEEDEDPETREHASKLLKDLEDDLAKGKKKDSWKFSLALHLRRFKLNNPRGKKIQASLKDASEKDDDDDEDRDFIEKPEKTHDKHEKPEKTHDKHEKPEKAHTEKSPKPEKQKVKKIKSSGGGSSDSSSSSSSEDEKDSNDKDKEGKKKSGFGLPGLKLSIGGKDKPKDAKVDKEKEKKDKEEKAKKEKEEKEKAKKEQEEKKKAEEEKKKADKEKERLEKEKAKADKTKKTMDLPEEGEVMKSKSGEHTSVAPPVVVVAAEPEHHEEEKNCHLCHSENAKFTCKNCGHKVCANDSTTKFTSFLLGWKHHKRVCDSCLENIKVEISKKSQDDPSTKEQADKELQGINDARVKISKKKQSQSEGKKDYSSSSSSSSSSDASPDESGNAKSGKKLKLPGFGLKGSSDKEKSEKSDKEKHEKKHGEDDEEKRKRGLSIGKPSFGFGKGEKDKSDKSEKEKLKAEKEKAEKEKAEKEKAEKEKIKADKEKADKEKAEKLKAEKEKADKEKADKEKQKKEEKEKAEKEKAEKAKKVPSGKAEVTAEAEVETMGKSKRVEATADVHANCHVCHDDFSKKRQYSCRNCGEKVCGECSTTRFASFLLSWKQNHRLCEHCLEHMKTEISKKSSENPNIKDQADAELRAANDLKTRISKKKAKAEVSGSSSSSSDSDSHSDNDYVPITSAHSSHVLDCHSGSQVTVTDKSDSVTQKWRITKKGKIESKSQKGLVLDHDNGKVVVKPKSKSDSQKWKVEGNGVIVNKQTGTALDLEGASKEKDAHVVLGDKNGNTSQLWNVELPKKKVKANIKLPGFGLKLGGHADKSDKEKADKEKADKEKADKEKAEKEKADKSDKEKSDKEKADKEKADKEKADKEKSEKTKAEKAPKEKSEKVPKDKKVKKEKKDKKKGEDSSSSSSSSSSEDEKDKEKVSGSIGKKKGFGLNLKLGKSGQDKSDKDIKKAEKAAQDKLKKEEKEKEKLEKEKQKKEEKEKQDKEKADKEKQKKEEKDKADKEKADKEKADKEKADKEKTDKPKKVAPLVALDVKKKNKNKSKTGSDSDSSSDSDSDSDDDYHEVTSNLNGLVLDGDLNHPVTTATKSNSNTQKWRLNKSSQLENANGHVIDYKEENGIKRLYVVEKDQNSETQKFQLENSQIVNKSTGLAVDIKEAKKEAGADVVLWEKHGKEHQQWKWDFSLKLPKIKLNKKEKKPKQEKEKEHKEKEHKEKSHDHDHGPCPFCRREYQILNPEVDEEMQKLNNGEISKEEMLRKKLEMIGKAEKLLAEMKIKYEAELAELKK